MALSKEALQLENDMLIQGYIRKSYEKINVNKDCISVIDLFYFETDEFKNHSDWHILKNNNKTAIVTSTKQDYSWVFCTNFASNKNGLAKQVCINRFDDETKQSFMELYDKVDADFEMPTEEVKDEGQN